MTIYNAYQIKDGWNQFEDQIRQQLNGRKRTTINCQTLTWPIRYGLYDGSEYQEPRLNTQDSSLWLPYLSYRLGYNFKIKQNQLIATKQNWWQRLWHKLAFCPAYNIIATFLTFLVTCDRKLSTLMIVFGLILISLIQIGCQRTELQWQFSENILLMHQSRNELQHQLRTDGLGYVGLILVNWAIVVANCHLLAHCNLPFYIALFGLAFLLYLWNWLVGGVLYQYRDRLNYKECEKI